jgi:CRP/FNR family transcriptional regulator
MRSSPAERTVVRGEKLPARTDEESADSGPSLRAGPFRASANAETAPVLSPRQRQQLLAIATTVRLSARSVIYREQTPASWIFINAEGVVKSFRELRSGRRCVMSFWYPKDLFGLASNGLYVRTAQAVTAVTLYRIETDVLVETLRRDADLQLKFLCKVTHELRETQRQAIIVGRRDAVGRLAMFIRHLERSGQDRRHPGDIELPMSRSDIASYIGLSLESVSRAASRLQRRGIVSFPNRHSARILDRMQFERLATAV